MSWYRNMVFMVKGVREYTLAGYQRAAERFLDADLPQDCGDRVFLVTGANSGIGRSLAGSLARLGGSVHMVCRNATAAEAAAADIRGLTGNQRVHVHLVDMARPADVRAFATRFCEAQSRLDVLINNAGCMINERTLTDDGLEANFATNTVSVHALTTGLAPLLTSTAGSRVVTVSSAGMLTQRLDVDDVNSQRCSTFDGTAVYAQNKRQQVVMMEQYAVKYPDIKFYSMHPGWADTPAVRTSMPDFYNRMQGRLRTAEQGADTALWLAVSEAACQQPSGGFYQDRQLVDKHLPLARTASCPGDEERLIQLLDQYYSQFSAAE